MNTESTDKLTTGARKPSWSSPLDWVAGVVDATSAILLRVDSKSGLPFGAFVRVRATRELQQALCDATGLGHGRAGYWVIEAAQQLAFIEMVLPRLRCDEVRALVEKVRKFRRTQELVRAEPRGTVLPAQIERFRRRLVAGTPLHRLSADEYDALAPSLQAQRKQRPSASGSNSKKRKPKGGK